jgi:4-aminobutyrate aminotransferase
VFYTNSGSEAIDTAIKMAKWHTRRPYGIGFVNGFHGRTLGAVSFTSTGVSARRGFAPLYPIGHFVPYPYCYRCLFNREYPSCDLHCLSYLTEVTLKKLAPPDEVAFLLVEAVQGAGGYIVPPKEFLPRIQEICRQHGIVLIVDEVQTGFGRTGKMWASEHFGVAPDILAISKAFAHGLPAGAAVARAEVMNWDAGAHEGTLNGGPVILEAAKAVLRVIGEERLVEKSRVQGDYLKGQLLALQSKYPLIGDVRGLGLMVGIELVADAQKTPAKDKRDRLLEEAFRKGLLLLGAGECSIRLAPPLVITQGQLDQGLSILEDCLKAQA